MKKWISCLLAAAMLLSAGALNALAADNPFYDEPDDLPYDESDLPGYQEPAYEEPAQPDQTAAPQPEQTPEPAPAPADSCGDNLQWTLEGGTLTVTGIGPMYDFPNGKAPWEAYHSQITTVILGSGVSTVGEGAFRDYDNLTSVQFGSSMAVLGTGAFAGCDGLTELSFPNGFRILGEDCLRDCLNLKTIRFSGGMPSFKLNCLWGTSATVVYPAGSWPAAQIEKLSKSFQGRIKFQNTEGQDPMASRNPQETTAPAETTETVPAPTMTVPTLPVATKPAQTEAPALPAETEAPETVPAETALTDAYVNLPEKEESSGSPAMAAGLIALMVVSAGGIIFLLVRTFRNGKKDFTGDFSEILLEDEKKPGKKKSGSGKKPSAGKKRTGGK